jgi:glycine/D-amino acid oxidase-like deaminating enzyme
VLIDAPGPPAPASDRALGIAAVGAADSPARLALSLPDHAEALWRFSTRGVDSLLERAQDLGVSVSRKGSWRLTLGADEEREWETSVALLNRWGIYSRSVSGAEAAADGLGAGFAGAHWIAEDGQLDPAGLSAALRARLDRRVTRRPGPGRLDVSLGGVRIHTAAGPVAAETAVVAAGVGSASVHPWFAPMIVPVRLQGLRVPGASLPGPALARHRFEAWVSDPEGLSFVGCRWAEQPEMEAGITDDASTSPAVESAAREFFARHHPALDLSNAHAWCGIAAFSCDGLPLVGPLPGEPRVHALCGWGGWGLSWMGAAVEGVAAAILGDQGPAVIPAMLRPRRMI